MSPVLTPTLLDPIAETLELSETELGRLFGVSRQAVGQWRERGVPSNRMAKVTTVAAICDLLGHRLKPERIPGVARRPAKAYGGLSMLEMIERDRQDELLSAGAALVRLGDDGLKCGRSAGAGPTCGWPTRTGTIRSTAATPAERGGRWNPPESFPVVYLCRSVPVARANVYRKLEGQPYGPEDLRPGAGRSWSGPRSRRTAT